MMMMMIIIIIMTTRVLEDFGFVVLFGLEITIQMSYLMCILGSFSPMVDIP